MPYKTASKKSSDRARKERYLSKVNRLLDTYSKVFVVHCDNVGSAQMQQIRHALTGTAEVLMGKNTMIRKGFNEFLSNHPDHPAEPLLNRIVGNVGLVFTNADLTFVKDRIEENRVPAPAKSGAVAPNDVIVPAGPTGCDPGQTSFFQALNIATKINRGQIEIINDVHLMSTGEKVQPGQAALLSKLSIKPFTYGLVITLVYDDGALFDPKVLSLTTDDIADRFVEGVRNIAAVSLETGIPTLASIPHSLATAVRFCVAICADDQVDYSFKLAEPILAFLADPSAFAAAAAPAGGAGAAEEEEEEEEEEASGAVGGLFGDEDDEGY